VTLKIRQSLQIEEILKTAVTEVQRILQADRVLIFQLGSDGSGKVVKEAVVPGWPVILGQSHTDPCLWYVDGIARDGLVLLPTWKRLTSNLAMLNFYSSLQSGQPCGANSPRDSGGCSINALIRGSGLAELELLQHLANQMGIA